MKTVQKSIGLAQSCFTSLQKMAKKYTFLTNIDADDETMLKLIVQCYDKRWSIETGYRTESKFWCKTASKVLT